MSRQASANRCITGRGAGLAGRLIVALVVTGLAPPAMAADDPDEAAHSAAAAQANNPLANFTAVNLQDYYIGKLTSPDKSANQFWMRYAQPISLGSTNWIFRASLPVSTLPVAPSFSSTTGIGDLNAFAAYLIDTGDPAVSFGIGPQLTVPTGNDDVGSKKWSAGLANVLFNASSRRFQYGYLLTWQASFAGSDDHPDVNVGAFQPFLFYQLGKGLYLRSAPIWTYNFENKTYSMPLGVGIGQVIPTRAVVYNLFVEPQWSVADKGAGYPKWQIFFGFNMQFKR
jgi:hypothetical protein